ncbi:MAG: tetratricopeptide repeat protein, partial [Symploca sp. SIO2C1]|nr:tetratricopeptide repeat protein [Symploca sp. SIO2C1]
MGLGNNAEGWLKQAKEQFEAGDFEGAIASYNQALEIKPDNHHTWYDQGRTLDQLGRYEEAIASLDQAIQIKPDWHRKSTRLNS